MNGKNAAILVVDDSPDVRKYIAMNLEARGYEVITAVDGLEALRILDGREVDLVLLDITMPGLNGIEVCGKIRQRSDVPIVMVTASGLDAAAPALQRGANGYLGKPFAVGELLEMVQRMLRQGRERAEYAGGEAPSTS